MNDMLTIRTIAREIADAEITLAHIDVDDAEMRAKYREQKATAKRIASVIGIDPMRLAAATDLATATAHNWR